MPSIRCKNCGRATNSATSDYWEHSLNTLNSSFEATECYAAIQDGRWAKGCGFGRATSFQRSFALKVIEWDNKKHQDRESPP